MYTVTILISTLLHSTQEYYAHLMSGLVKVVVPCSHSHSQYESSLKMLLTMSVALQLYIVKVLVLIPQYWIYRAWILAIDFFAASMWWYQSRSMILF